MRSNLIFQKYCKIALKFYIGIAITLYFHLWISKMDDNSRELGGSILFLLDQNGKSFARNHLKVVSYNMWCNYLAKSNSNYIERFKGFAEGVKDADIVLVQEIFILRVGPVELSSCATEMITVMREHKFEYRTSVSNTVPYIFGQSNGLVIFSKVPFTRTNYVVYNDSDILEKCNNKGFVLAELLMGGKKIVVFNTHTDAHKVHIRELQMKQLASFIRKYNSSSVIIGGDLNINSPNIPPGHSNEREYKNMVKNMKSLGLRPVFTKHKRTHLDGCSYDHFFVSLDLKVEERKVINLLTDKREMVSDHFGLFMKIKL